MARPIVALLSDFGTRDHYAGTLKAVVLSVCPDATLVDATCGGGGHTAAILERSRPARVILLDRDPAALEHAKRRLVGAPCPLEFRHARFSSLAGILDELEIPCIAA